MESVRNGKFRNFQESLRSKWLNAVVIEVKNHKRLDLSAWIKELEVEIKNDNAWTGVVLHKRLGKGDVGEWYATMPAKLWIELIRKINGQT